MSSTKIELVVVILAVIGSVTGLKSCSRNANLMKSIQYQLKLVEDNEGRYDCDHRGSDHSRVGFLAMNTRHLQNVGNGNTVVYDSVTTNVGGGYNPSSGIFTAPSAGLHYFSWTSLSHAGKHFFTQLYVNSNIIARNYVSSQGLSQHIGGSQSVVVHLKKGDKVAIKIQSGGGQFLHGDKWSTFSGFRI